MAIVLVSEELLLPYGGVCIYICLPVQCIALFSPFKLVLLQGHSDDHSSGFNIFSRYVRLGSCEHLITTSLVVTAGVGVPPQTLD